jgi:hypothetical protein
MIIVRLEALTSHRYMAQEPGSDINSCIGKLSELTYTNTQTSADEEDHQSVNDGLESSGNCASGVSSFTSNHCRRVSLNRTEALKMLVLEIYSGPPITKPATLTALTKDCSLPLVSLPAQTPGSFQYRNPKRLVMD